MDITLAWPVVSTIIAIVVGIISYFLKRTMETLDKCEESVQCKADRADVTAVRTDMQNRVDRLDRDVASIRTDYITKEDFFREQAKTDRKLDQIIQILMKGGVRDGD